MELYNWNHQICRADYDEATELYGTSLNSKIAPITINHINWQDMRKKKFLFVGKILIIVHIFNAKFVKMFS